MSKAFDSINRSKLLIVLKNIIDEDSLRMIHMLLSETQLLVRIGPKESRLFPTNVGTPQGDTLSPILFIIYLEAALRNLRAEIGYMDNQVVELIYADDLDFITENPKLIEIIMEKAKTILDKWSLKVNEEKTEITTVERMPTRIDEKWRNVRKLGSLLGDSEDITRRKILSTIALKKLQSIWMRKKQILTKMRLRLYDAFVRPVLMYNAGTWGTSKKNMEQLDTFHRGQLRKLLGYSWPKKISNDKLYRSANCGPISLNVLETRWRLFGHILRMKKETPCNMVMEEFFDHTEYSKYRGRPRDCLPGILTKEYAMIGGRLMDANNLDEIRKRARRRKGWKELTTRIVKNMAQAKP
ncbi:uncharacterized protein LOC115227307 [Octopus sinensis]|uniref:Uncharacterized protein LOC115227307 n=1 Tax=Octopus sinensis TaxID=2607531 RepID=A0A6P7TXN6_9MOLL|nr:uncharacterized protein LOC115227307 [Octopus sinensis]